MAIQNLQGNSPAGNAPNPQAFGLKSPQEAIDVLSLVAIVGAQGQRTNIVGDQKAFGDPSQKAQAVVEFFKSSGLSPKELLALGAAVKRDLRNGTLKLDQTSSRIEITAEALTGKYLPLARRLANPHAEIIHSELRKPVQAKPAAVPEVKAEMLGNVGGGPQIDPASYVAAYELKGNAFEAIATLFPQLKELSHQAYNQEKMLEGAAHA